MDKAIFMGNHGKTKEKTNDALTDQVSLQVQCRFPWCLKNAPRTFLLQK